MPAKRKQLEEQIPKSALLNLPVEILLRILEFVSASVQIPDLELIFDMDSPQQPSSGVATLPLYSRRRPFSRRVQSRMLHL
jgi:hypothetical protein